MSKKTETTQYPRGYKNRLTLKICFLRSGVPPKGKISTRKKKLTFGHTYLHIWESCHPGKLRHGSSKEYSYRSGKRKQLYGSKKMIQQCRSPIYAKFAKKVYATSLWFHQAFCFWRNFTTEGSWKVWEAPELIVTLVANTCMRTLLRSLPLPIYSSPVLWIRDTLKARRPVGNGREVCVQRKFQCLWHPNIYNFWSFFLPYES